MSEEVASTDALAKSLAELLAGLTPKQAEFLEALPANNWQAYKTIRVLGFSTRTLWTWMQEPDFAAARGLLQTRFMEAIGATYERTLAEVARIAYADIREILGSGNKLADAAEWDDETAAAVASIETETRYERQGEDLEEVIVTKVKMHPKLDALKTLLGIHGKLVDRHEHTGKDGSPLVSTAPIVNVIIGGKPARD